MYSDVEALIISMKAVGLMSTNLKILEELFDGFFWRLENNLHYTKWDLYKPNTGVETMILEQSSNRGEYTAVGNVRMESIESQTQICHSGFLSEN